MKARPRLRALLTRLWGEHATPSRLGAAVGVGVVVGCSPCFGFHLPIGVGLALLFRLNKIAVLIGSQISIPPLAPLLGFASVQLGARILEGHFLSLGTADFALTRLPSLIPSFFLCWLLGGLLVGVALGLPAGLVTGLVVRSRRRRSQADPWRAQLRSALVRYRGVPRGHRGYLRFKLPMDPVYRLVCEGLGSVDTLIDLGTGLGALPILLAQRGQVRRAIGVEWDAAKAESARRASAGLEVEILEGDARSLELPPADAVLLIDLLHYYPLEEQRALLARAAGALRPGGQLVVWETVRQRRSLLTRLIEGAAVALRWNKGPGLRYLAADELRSELERLGLRCAAAEGASSAIHRGNQLLWARAEG